MSTEVKEVLEPETKATLEKVANTIRHLSMDAVQKANSGHPGLPLGCAEIGAALYGALLHHNPRNPKWLNRDRFILSAGHGSMLLYSCLHLAGFALSLDDVKKFRQLHSLTPGHPEADVTPGVETTTGPLGQGIGNAVGMALGLKLLGTAFNTEEHRLFDAKIYCLAGDGCMMEGISSEACSLAGHLGLDNLILIYDANKICLDGPLSEVFSEDVAKRFEAYGWDVCNVDGHSLEEICSSVSRLRENQLRPTLVIARTIIGKGSPKKEGSHKVHGSPLGTDEVAASKEALGLPEEEFHIPQIVKAFFESKREEQQKKEEQWDELYKEWAKANPELAERFQTMKNNSLPENIEQLLWNLDFDEALASRVSSQKVLSALGGWLPQLYGGSADLSCSDMTMMKQFGIVVPKVFTGRNIKYGVREFAMGAMATGLAQTQMITPYVGTFLTFSDYMRNAIRLAAMMKEQVIYQLTHDSIFLGEDGPTHQPVEHLTSLRSIPHLHVIRPADDHEVRMAWLAALRYQGPTALILSRQKLQRLECTKVPYEEGMGRGAYIVRREETKPDFTLFATGSELSLALSVADELEKLDKQVRVVSMPCWELFEEQEEEYYEQVVGGDLGCRVSLEAGSDQCWYKYIGREGIAIAVEGFGTSAPASAVAREYGFTIESVLERIL